MADTVAVVLPDALVRLFPGAARRLEMQVSSVAALVTALDARWPGMGDRLRDSTPALRRHLNIFVDGNKARLDTPIPPGAEVIVMTAMSGG